MTWTISPAHGFLTYHRICNICRPGVQSIWVGAGHLLPNAQCTVNAVDEWFVKAYNQAPPVIAPVRPQARPACILFVIKELFYIKNLFSFEHVINGSADFMSKDAQSFCLSVFFYQLLLVFFDFRDITGYYQPCLWKSPLKMGIADLPAWMSINLPCWFFWWLYQDFWLCDVYKKF